MDTYLTSAIKQFEYYKGLGDRVIARLSFDALVNEIAVDSNSVAIIVKHLSGNMLSRWTNFLTEDGEKSWRNRDLEFENMFASKADIKAYWEEGWNCLFSALNALSSDDLNTIIFIRNEGHSVVEAINRQLCHYAYHVGQMVFLGKLILGKDWETLSIAKGNSTDYNSKKFKDSKGIRHFTDNL